MAWQCQTHLSKFVRETGRSAFNSVWLVVAIQCLHLFPRGLSKGIGWRLFCYSIIRHADRRSTKLLENKVTACRVACSSLDCHLSATLCIVLVTCLCSCMPVHACPSHLSASLCLSARLIFIYLPACLYIRMYFVCSTFCLCVRKSMCVRLQVCQVGNLFPNQIPSVCSPVSISFICIFLSVRPIYLES